jgi:hypothetical protein
MLRAVRTPIKEYPVYSHAETWSVEAQGRVLKLSIPKQHQTQVAAPRNVGRGAVTRFSHKSRLRLMETANRIDPEKVFVEGRAPKFITLTYKRNMREFDAAKTHLDNFIKRMQRKDKESSCIWRMELQRRGAIHFHLVVFGMSFWRKEDMQASWGEIIGESSFNASVGRPSIRTFTGGEFCSGDAGFNASVGRPSIRTI